MKFKSKIAALFIIILALVITMTVSVSAESSECEIPISAPPSQGGDVEDELPDTSIDSSERGDDQPATDTESSDAVEKLPETDTESSYTGGKLPETNIGSSETKEDKTGGATTFFEELYAAFMEHSEKILGALTLVGSLILAFMYKKGFLPLVKTSLSALIETVGKIKDSTAKNDLIYKDFAVSLGERLDNTEELLGKLTTHIDTLTDSLGAAETVMLDNERLKIIIKAQVDMLYDVFMCSSLPEFQKEAVSEKIKEMKEALGK